MEWTGACQEGWLHGQGLLRWFDHTGRLASHFAGLFERGDFISGDYWWIGDGIGVKDPLLTHFAFAGGLRENRKLPPSSAPPALYAVHQERRLEQANARAALSEPEEQGSDASNAFVEIVNGLAGAMRQYGHARGQQEIQKRLHDSMQRGDLAGEDIARKQLAQLQRLGLNQHMQAEAEQRGAAIERKLANEARVRGQASLSAEDCLAGVEGTAGTPSWAASSHFSTYWCRSPAVHYACSADDHLLKRFLSSGQAQACTPNERLAHGSRFSRTQGQQFGKLNHGTGWKEMSILCFSGSSAYLRFDREGKKPNIYVSCHWD